MKTLKIIITGLIILVSTSVYGQKNLKTIEIQTSAQCEMCKDRIENALVYAKGIKNAVLNLDTKIVTVTFNIKKTSEDQIIKILTDLGYDAANQKGNQDAYKNLPNCCKKPDDRL
jgi:copper chaperone CopZ